jgi:hypothetical protein
VDTTAREQIEQLLHEVTDVHPGYDLGPKVVALAKAVRILADAVLEPSAEAPAEVDPGPIETERSNAGMFPSR